MYNISIDFILIMICITGEKIDIMKPRAIGACNEKIANKMVKLIREADQKVK